MRSYPFIVSTRDSILPPGAGKPCSGLNGSRGSGALYTPEPRVLFLAETAAAVNLPIGKPAARQLPLYTTGLFLP
jgi:hypothetical protein